jgi:hypothetical protein
MISDNSLEKIKLISNDSHLISALREVFNEAMIVYTPKVEKGEGDAILGQKMRAYESAKKIIEESFAIINSFGSSNGKKEEFNKYR